MREVLDLVYIVPESFALFELLSVIEDEARQVAQALLLAILWVTPNNAIRYCIG